MIRSIVNGILDKRSRHGWNAMKSQYDGGDWRQRCKDVTEMLKVVALHEVRMSYTKAADGLDGMFHRIIGTVAIRNRISARVGRDGNDPVVDVNDILSMLRALLYE